MQIEIVTKCSKCTSEHKLDTCDVFKALSSDENASGDARLVRTTRPNELSDGVPYSESSETVTNIGTGESKALLKIVLVTIRAADKEVKVHALLDDGESESVRTENDVERDFRCRTIARLDLPSQSFTVDEIFGHRYLRECYLEALHNIRPLLLIRQDNWKLITGSDVRRGKLSELGALLTGLGWVMHVRRNKAPTGPTWSFVSGS
ncbi:hypothetical protein EVAR_74465_1 [Eumeta japonica]|uniref:Uncharacterized protein n=1 Tax=Eumeta variegata TaxID=151549 RepID=A0A4C1TE09_EUMVA|nr:hypothetical protein EVAR_74465_1 [Eumeta japonica]